MEWTWQQVVTTAISSVALVLSVANFITAKLRSKKEEALRRRNDLLNVDQLLDAAYELIYGSEGYCQTNKPASLIEADVLVQRAKKIDPNYPRLVEYEGHLYEVEGNKSAAEERYRKSCCLDPTRARAYRCLGQILDGDESIVNFQQAIELEPDKAASSYFSLGLVYQLEQGKAEDAKECFTKAIELVPKYSAAHFALGRLQNDEGLDSEARSSYEKAISADATSVLPMVYLGRMLMNDGNDEDGLEWFEHARKVDPLDDSPASWLAAIYADRGAPEKALVYAEQALALNPRRRFSGDILEELRIDMRGLLDKQAPKEYRCR